MILPVGSLRCPDHLRCVVDPIRIALTSTKRAEIGHAYAIRARDEGIHLPVVVEEYLLPPARVVDPQSPAMVSTECAEVGYACAIGAGDESIANPLAVVDRPTTCPSSLIPKA